MNGACDTVTVLPTGLYLVCLVRNCTSAGSHAVGPTSTPILKLEE